MAIHGTAFGGGLEIAMAGHYRVAVAYGAGGAAGGEARHHSRRRRDAAAAAPGRRRQSGRDVRVRRADRREDSACGWESSTRSSRAICSTGAIEFAREASRASWRSRRASATRNCRMRPRTRRSSRVAREQARKTRRGQIGAARRHRRRGSGHRGFRSRTAARAKRSFSSVCLFSTQSKALIHAFFGERAVAKIPDIPKETQDLRHPQCGGHRRGHHGRRHRHELRQRRHSGDRQGDQPGSARPRHRDHPQELRKTRSTRAVFAADRWTSAWR